MIVPDKAERVANFHKNTLHALAEVIGASGLMHPSEIRASQLHRRISPTQTMNFAELYPVMNEGELLSGDSDPALQKQWKLVSAEHFG